MARASYSTTPLLRSLVHRPQGVILVIIPRTMNTSTPFLLTEMSSIEVLIVTLIKASIHKSRMNKSQLSLEKMLQSLKLEASKEYRIARSKEKTCVFEQKWGNLKKLAA